MNIGGMVKGLVKGADAVLDIATGPIDLVASALPGPLGDLLKVGAGAFTANPLLLASGVAGLVSDAASGRSCGPSTEVPFRSDRFGAGYAPLSSLGPAGRDRLDGLSRCLPSGLRALFERLRAEAFAKEGGVPVRYDPSSHLDSNYAGYVDALKVLDQNWLTFDSAVGARDCYLTRDNLAAVVNNPRASSDLKRAARFLLDHPEYYARLEMAAGIGGRDGVVGHGDVKAALNTARREISQYGLQPPEGSGYGAGGRSSASGLGDVMRNPNMSLEDKVMWLLNSRLSELDGQLERLTAQLSGAEVGGKDERNLQMQLQQVMEKRSQMFMLMSTLSQKFNELAKTAIQNMGRA